MLTYEDFCFLLRRITMNISLECLNRNFLEHWCNFFHIKLNWTKRSVRLIVKMWQCWRKSDLCSSAQYWMQYNIIFPINTVTFLKRIFMRQLLYWRALSTWCLCIHIYWVKCIWEWKCVLHCAAWFTGNLCDWAKMRWAKQRSVK